MTSHQWPRKQGLTGLEPVFHYMASKYSLCTRGLAYFTSCHHSTKQHIRKSNASVKWQNNSVNSPFWKAVLSKFGYFFKNLKKTEKQLQSIHNETGNKLNNRRFFFPKEAKLSKKTRDRKGAVMSPDSLSICVKVFSPLHVQFKLQVSQEGMLWEGADQGVRLCLHPAPWPSQVSPSAPSRQLQKLLLLQTKPGPVFLNPIQQDQATCSPLILVIYQMHYILYLHPKILRYVMQKMNKNTCREECTLMLGCCA